MPDQTSTLSEDQRRQLDGIVSQMESNQETPENIQFVVDDFKKKYAGGVAPKADAPQSFQDRIKNVETASDKAVLTSPNLPSLTGGIAGALTGGTMAIPVAGATAMLTSAAQGGTPTQNVTQGVLNAGTEAIGPLVSAAGSKVAPWLMQKAVKPAQSLLDEYRIKAPQMAKFLLDEGVSVTEAGSAKLERLFHATNQEIKDAIASSKGVVYPEAVANRTQQTMSRVTNQVDPFADRAAVQETTNNFLNHPNFAGDTFPRRPMPVQEAQPMKVGTYQNLKGKYGELGAAKIEAEKGLARGLKEDIASEVMKEGTDINAKNAREAMILASQEAVDKQLVQHGNANPAGFAMVAAHHPVGFLTALFDRSPAAKSLVARGLFEAAGRMTGVAPAVIRGAVKAILASPDHSAPAPSGQ